MYDIIFYDKNYGGEIWLKLQKKQKKHSKKI